MLHASIVLALNIHYKDANFHYILQHAHTALKLELNADDNFKTIKYSLYCVISVYIYYQV